MVVALGPGKFYGSSLPRPRVYTDVKFSSERVDPPAPVTDPLISWAQEAHWAMGGLSSRSQGRIEGSINRLRSQKETKTPSPSPPAAPVAAKRRRRIVEEEEEEVEVTRRTVRKLEDEFDMVATTVDDAQNRPEKEGVVVAETHNRGGLIGRRLIKGLKGSIKRP